jgi:SAM-dependent methyltransferase
MHAAWQRRILKRLDAELPSGAVVLDFGCGDGSLVEAYEEAGFVAYGCDITLPEETDRLRLIPEPYRLPFPDEFFDFVGSNQVFEHVQAPDAAVREIARVMKPGATSIHLFPARYRWLEPHPFVPFATVVQAHAWLKLWARLGIRNRFQRGRSAPEVAALNRSYLTSSTNYLRRLEIVAVADRQGLEIAFIEGVSLAISTGRARRLALLAARVPALARAYSELRARVVLFRKPDSRETYARD